MAKVKKSEKIELKNAKQRLERAKGPFCGYKFGKKSENSGKTCGDFCVDATLYPNKEGEMITLCVKHVKTAATKHTCQFPDKNKNECGKRVPDEETEPYSRKGEWKGLTYCGLWICGQHKPIADKNLDKASHPCTKTNTKGKKCERVAQKNEDGTWSSQCTSCNKRDQKKISKKAADQRKALKKGKKEKKGKGKKAEKDEVVVSEVKEEKLMLSKRRLMTKRRLKTLRRPLRYLRADRRRSPARMRRAIPNLKVRMKAILRVKVMMRMISRRRRPPNHPKSQQTIASLIPRMKRNHPTLNQLPLRKRN